MRRLENKMLISDLQFVANPFPGQPRLDDLPVEKISPLKRWRMDGARLANGSQHHFNGSIVEWRGRTLVAYRSDVFDAKIHICTLDASGQVDSDVLVDVPRDERNSIAVEDPRCFVFDGSLWLAIAGVTKHHITDRAHTNMQLVRLDSDTLQPVESIFPEYTDRREWEKNWGFFEYGDRLLAVYDVAPNHVVVEVDRRSGNVTTVDRREFDWPVQTLGHPRGGCSPVLYRNEWYNFVHCVMSCQGQRWYAINLYTFENKPPFRPARILPFPLLLPSTADRWNDAHPNVVFPAGVVRDGAKWTISYGYHDKWIEIAEWDGNWLELSLEPIPGGPYDLSLRPGWHDIGVWRDVYTANDYELPDKFEASDTIVDVGGHIGSFTRACLDRGAGLVVSCEPEFGSHWRANLASYGDRARLVEHAIGGESAMSCVDPYDGSTYASVSTRDNYGLTIPLGSVLQGLGPVRLLKLDCEGPEFSIVAETDLSQVEEIIGEVHPYRDGLEVYDWPRFEELLARQGFTITKAVRPGATWLFWCHRTDWRRHSFAACKPGRPAPQSGTPIPSHRLTPSKAAGNTEAG